MKGSTWPPAMLRLPLPLSDPVITCHQHRTAIAVVRIRQLKPLAWVPVCEECAQNAETEWRCEL